MFKEWTKYDHFDGLIIEHVKQYWDQIQTDEGMSNANVPDTIGKKIDPPPDVDTKEVIACEQPMPFIEGSEDDIERYKIWCENIHKLIKKETVVTYTPEGPQEKIVHHYPAEFEQRKMVEKIYQERNKCQSNSEK